MQKGKKAFVIAAAAVSFIAVAYFGFTLFFTDHFYMNTIINGVDYSACSVEVVQNRIMDTSGHYSLTINGRDGMTDMITSSDIALRSVFGDEFEEVIAGQNAFLWPFSLFQKSEHTVDTVVTYSKEELERRIDALCFFQPENIRQPRNAYLSDYTEEGYQVIPEDKGTVPVRQKIYRAVEEAVDTLADSVNLDEKDCYTNARVTSSDSELQRICEQKNRLTGVTITYTFGEDVEVLDGNTIKDWLIEEEGKYDIDAELVRARHQPGG